VGGVLVIHMKHANIPPRFEPPPVIIDALAGAGELHPMLQQAKAARPAPKKKAA